MARHEKGGWLCLKPGCGGRIRGVREGRREVLHQDDEKTCPKCGEKYTVEVIDYAHDSAVAELVSTSSLKEGQGELSSAQTTEGK